MIYWKYNKNNISYKSYKALIDFRYNVWDEDYDWMNCLEDEENEKWPRDNGWAGFTGSSGYITTTTSASSIIWHNTINISQPLWTFYNNGNGSGVI
jgi:hypothetical protein